MITHPVPHQFVPFNHRIGDVRLIVYPIKNSANLHDLLVDKKAIRQHLDKLYKIHDEDLGRGRYHIVFVWVWRGLLMTDVWIHQRSMLGADLGGDVLIDRCVVYKGFEPYAPVGIASDNTLVVLGHEEEHRWKFDSIEEYLDRSKSLPDFPEGFAPTEDY